jgi:hypothetical protein
MLVLWIMWMARQWLHLSSWKTKSEVCMLVRQHLLCWRSVQAACAMLLQLAFDLALLLPAPSSVKTPAVLLLLTFFLAPSVMGLSNVSAYLLFASSISFSMFGVRGEKSSVVILAVFWGTCCFVHLMRATVQRTLTADGFDC